MFHLGLFFYQLYTENNANFDAVPSKCANFDAIQ